MRTLVVSEPAEEGSTDAFSLKYDCSRPIRYIISIDALLGFDPSITMPNWAPSADSMRWSKWSPNASTRSTSLARMRSLISFGELSQWVILKYSLVSILRANWLIELSFVGANIPMLTLRISTDMAKLNSIISIIGSRMSIIRVRVSRKIW